MLEKDEVSKYTVPKNALDMLEWPPYSSKYTAKDIPMTDSNHPTPEEVDAEFSKFLKEALNPLLSNVAGMEKMPTMSLEQGSNGKPILQLNETLSGSGELSRFIAEAAELKGGEEHIGIFRF